MSNYEEKKRIKCTASMLVYKNIHECLEREERGISLILNIFLL